MEAKKKYAAPAAGYLDVLLTRETLLANSGEPQIVVEPGEQGGSEYGPFIPL